MKLCHQQDAEIINDDREMTKGERMLYDCDGALLFVFPSDWSDDQVMKALDFANDAFEKGRIYGRAEKGTEIRRALGINP